MRLVFRCFKPIEQRDARVRGWGKSMSFAPQLANCGAHANPFFKTVIGCRPESELLRYFPEDHGFVPFEQNVLRVGADDVVVVGA